MEMSPATRFKSSCEVFRATAATGLDYGSLLRARHGSDRFPDRQPRLVYTAEVQFYLVVEPATAMTLRGDGSSVYDGRLIREP